MTLSWINYPILVHLVTQSMDYYPHPFDCPFGKLRARLRTGPFDNPAADSGQGSGRCLRCSLRRSKPRAVPWSVCVMPCWIAASACGLLAMTRGGSCLLAGTRGQVASRQTQGKAQGRPLRQAPFDPAQGRQGRSLRQPFGRLRAGLRAGSEAWLKGKPSKPPRAATLLYRRPGLLCTLRPLATMRSRPGFPTEVGRPLALR
jgi:hypothetical protein